MRLIGRRRWVDPRTYARVFDRVGSIGVEGQSRLQIGGRAGYRVGHYWWWAVASDGFNLKRWLLDRFPLCLGSLPPIAKSELSVLGADLRIELSKRYVYKDNKGRIGNYFLPACESNIAAIDRVLATRVPQLTEQFVDDIRECNAMFSRANIDIEADGEDESAAD